MEALRAGKRYTYEDYYAWDDGERYELIDGEVWLMSAPLEPHQTVSVELILQLRMFLGGRRCRVYHAPFDVRLNPDGADDTVVQPDISVICDLSKINRTGCKGAPDMIIEILSPSSEARDRIVKFNKYLEAGVLEYWIVDPDSKTVQACLLQGGKYVTTSYGETDEAPVSILPGCVIRLSEVFEGLEPYI